MLYEPTISRLEILWSFIYCLKIEKVLTCDKINEQDFSQSIWVNRDLLYQSHLKPVKASEETGKINVAASSRPFCWRTLEVHCSPCRALTNRYTRSAVITQRCGCGPCAQERIFSATCFARRNLCKAAQLPNLWRIRICARHTLVLTRSQLVRRKYAPEFSSLSRSRVDYECVCARS